MRRTTTFAGTLAGMMLMTGCGAGIQDLPLGRSVPGQNYTVHVQLAHADGLLMGADVRNGQRVIGRVSGLSTDTVGAVVDLSLSSSVALPGNVEVAVELPSALGSPFIRLRSPAQPSSGALAAGDVIVESRTEIGPQIESVLAVLGTILTGSGFDQLQTVLDELNVAFGGRPQQVRGLLDTVTTLTGTAMRHQQDFDAAMQLAADISSRFASQQETIDEFLDVAPEVTKVLAGQRERIVTLLDSSAQLAGHVDFVLAQSPTGLDSVLGDAATVLSALRSVNSNMGETLTSMNGFLDNFDRAAKGGYLVFDGTLDIPGSIETLLTGGTEPLPAGTGSLQSLLSGGIR
ncbi:phospholipid/cholesterol/gamma-HCH transport system substrate-binding protein [Rhodococcus sp. OK519]|uniref:MCE family protein n=1 Tax=Rhodococcus sp. OK519 TaxID=2135729 RepID=UPI000D34CC59|nr:phospholipid/cholesterol/gamma-HCH transport system substrate-binding protein [Rhodococcus sp. OK519]